jgi:hypothetical protein
MFVLSVLLPGTGVCDEPITRPEESYRLWCPCVGSRNLVNEEIIAHVGPQRKKEEEEFIS